MEDNKIWFPQAKFGLMDDERLLPVLQAMGGKWEWQFQM